ncbi:MAG: class I SAM-dependent methyltransferase, partial [Candidatus Cloacimonadaceae bacterium]|nr:class I SAM-dependent methyltransferase [Candidatus Cloacimonadaceae bacterium]
MSDNTIYTEANRLAWNTAMPYHRKAKDNQWDTAFADPDFIIQKEPEISKLRELGIQDRDVVHLCCNNGLELMSLKRLGAKRSVGFDISDEAIKDAISRAARFGIAAEFYQSDVYAIPQDFHACFDVVYITIGALVWLPDLDGFFQMAASLLRPGGHVFIYEQHPFAQVLPWDVSGTCEKPSIQYD